MSLNIQHLNSNIRQIFIQNYIIPTLTIRLKYEKVAKIIQKWWRNLIKGYFKVTIIKYYNNANYHRHIGIESQLYAYSRTKKLFTVDLINDNTELQILPRDYGVYDDISFAWKDLYDELKSEILLNNYKNRHKYNFRIFADFNMNHYIWDDEHIFINEDVSNLVLIDNDYEDNEIFVEEFNNKFISKCREYISPNIN